MKISIFVVLSVLRQWFSTIEEPKFEGKFRCVLIGEMWAFVGRRKAGKKLMKKLAHLDIGEYCTDDWAPYKKHIPPQKHTISKARTQKIERQNLNFRTHLKRLCRRTICFSKKDDMHCGFIKAYVHLKNAA